MVTDALTSSLRDDHYRLPGPPGTQVCGGCGEAWPCRVRVLLARLELAEGRQRQRMLAAGVCP